MPVAADRQKKPNPPGSRTALQWSGWSEIVPTTQQGQDHEGQQREQSPKGVLELAIAVLALKVEDPLVTDYPARPLAEQTT